MKMLGPGVGNERHGVIAFYFLRLGLRSALMVAAVAAYIYARLHPEAPGLAENLIVNRGVWGICMFGIISRFFPSKHESRGCEKQFGANYRPRGSEPRGSEPRRNEPRRNEPRRNELRRNELRRNELRKLVPKRGVIATLIAWVALNLVFGVLYKMGVIDTGVMLIICVFYSVCDDICVLFYCPFQSLFMKNRCCVTCRIFSWDYAMIFTPLVFVSGIFFRILFILSLLLVVRWEMTCFLHPERFSEETNQFLACAGCKEKLCRYKWGGKLRNLGKVKNDQSKGRMR